MVISYPDSISWLFVRALQWIILHDEQPYCHRTEGANPSSLLLHPTTGLHSHHPLWQDGSYKEGSLLRWYCSLVIKCKHCRPFILIDSSQSTIKVIYLERVIYVYVWGGRGPLSCRCRFNYLKRKASQVSFIDFVGETRDMQPHAQRRFIYINYIPIHRQANYKIYIDT